MRTTGGEIRGSQCRLEDVAKACGLSKMSVSRALRGDRRNTSQQTIDRVCRMAREMGYQPGVHHAARRLALAKHGRQPLNHVAAFINNFGPSSLANDLYLQGLFLGATGGLADGGWAPLLVYAGEPRWEALLPLFARGDVDGALTTVTPAEAGPMIAELRAFPLFGPRPVVTLLYPLPGCSAVAPDDVDGGYRAASHLFDLGHRHLLVPLSADDHAEYAHIQRLVGYRRACGERGLDPEVSLHFLSWRYQDERVRTNLVLHLEAHPEITAILASNDRAALVIHEVLTAVGRRVPQDYSLLGFDDTLPLPGARGRNLLTTVRAPLEAVGRTAAQLMIERVTGVATEDRTVFLPVELIVRDTTAPPPGAVPAA